MFALCPYRLSARAISKPRTDNAAFIGVDTTRPDRARDGDQSRTGDGDGDGDQSRAGDGDQSRTGDVSWSRTGDGDQSRTRGRRSEPDRGRGSEPDQETEIRAGQGTGIRAGPRTGINQRQRAPQCHTLGMGKHQGDVWRWTPHTSATGCRKKRPSVARLPGVTDVRATSACFRPPETA